MRGADERVIVLVEEVLPEDELHVLVVLHPDLLRQLAEGTVEVGVGKLRLDLGQVAVLEGLLENGEGVERDGHVDVGLGGMEGRPDVAVADDPQVLEVGLFVPQPDGLGDALHDLVVRVGALSLRVDGHADDGGLDGTELVEDGFYVTGKNRSLSLSKGRSFISRPFDGLRDLAFTFIQPQPQVMDVVQGGAGVGPDEFFLELTDLAFEFLYLGAVGFALLEVLYLRREACLDVVDILQRPEPHGVAEDAVAEAAAHLVGVAAGDVVEVMVDVLLLLEAVALLEEVGVAHHLDATLMEVVQGVLESLTEEGIGDGVVARGHDGEVHLVVGRAQLPIDEGHEAQHDVVVVRTGVVDDLMLEGLGAAPELGFDVGDDLLHGVETKVRNAGAAGVVLQVLQCQLVGITVKDLAETEYGVFGLLEGPGAIKKSGVGFWEHDNTVFLELFFSLSSLFSFYQVFLSIKNLENLRIFLFGSSFLN